LNWCDVVGSASNWSRDAAVAETGLSRSICQVEASALLLGK
jgi:hypothetical protein